MADYHARTLGGVMYVNEPDKVRDARLFVTHERIRLRTGGAADVVPVRVRLSASCDDAACGGRGQITEMTGFQQKSVICSAYF